MHISHNVWRSPNGFFLLVALLALTHCLVALLWVSWWMDKLVAWALGWGDGLASYVGGASVNQKGIDGRSPVCVTLTLTLNPNP